MEKQALSETVGFKQLKYKVSKSNEFVTVTVEKKISEEVSFWARTVDDSAKSPGDYDAK